MHKLKRLEIWMKMKMQLFSRNRPYGSSCLARNVAEMAAHGRKSFWMCAKRKCKGPGTAAIALGKPDTVAFRRRFRPGLLH